MAGFIDILSDIVSSVVPKSIYDPKTGAILGGLSGIGVGGAQPQATGQLEAPRYGRFESARMPTYAPIGTVEAASGFTVGGVGIPAARALVRVAPGLARYLPAIERVVPKVLAAAGLAEAIYAIYTELRGRGMPHNAARRHAIIQAGGEPPRRRRMRATNIHALRRAIRRVHSFRRIARKVGALGTRKGGKLMPWRRRKVYRKGDVDPFLVEDYAEMLDEADDFDLDGDTFSDESSGEEALAE